MMTPPTVLLDSSILAALADPQHGWHERAREIYEHLLDRYTRNHCRLRARLDHLRGVDTDDHALRRSLFAPIEPIAVVGQHRRAAARLQLPVAVDADAAITLVVLRREVIHEIATFEPVFAEFDLTVIGTGEAADHSLDDAPVAH